MSLTRVLVFFIVSTWTLTIAVEEQDVIRLLRWKSPSVKSECHVLTDVAVQWDGADVFTEQTVQYSGYGDLDASSTCNELGIFCRYPEMSGWKVSGNLDIDVPLPPYTDSRWERLPSVSTYSCRSYAYNLNSNYFAISVKGDSVINIHLKGDDATNEGVYGIVLGNSVSSTVTAIGRYPNTICAWQRTTGKIQNANKWRHFWISVRNGNITVGHLNSTVAVDPISWTDPLPPLTYKYMSITSRSNDETLWKVHDSTVLYIQKRTKDHGFLEGYMQRNHRLVAEFACVSFWYYMTPNVGLSLDVHIAGTNHNISSSSSTLFEWKHFVGYNTRPFSSTNEYFMSIEGIFPEDAPDDAIIAISDIRKCGRDADFSHRSTIPGNNSLFCSLAFPPPPSPRIPCSKHCHNGGKCYNGKCVCALGFTGKRCEEGVPDNCSPTFDKCEGNQICSITTKQCVCSAGFEGKRCNRRCSKGTYGPNCAGRCGHCIPSASCKEHTGECPFANFGCQAHYRLPFCLFPPPYLKKGPILARATTNSLNINIRFGDDNYEGDGDPAFYSVHHRKVGDDRWMNEPKKELPQSNLSDFTSFYVIDDLEMDTEYTVQVVLFPADASLENSVDAPTSTFKTLKRNSLRSRPPPSKPPSQPPSTQPSTTKMYFPTAAIHLTDATTESPVTTRLQLITLESEVTSPGETFQPTADDIINRQNNRLPTDAREFYVAVNPDSEDPSEVSKNADNNGQWSLQCEIFGVVSIISILLALGIVVYVLTRRYKHRSNSYPVFDRVPLHSITKSDSVASTHVDEECSTLESDTNILCAHSV